MAARGELLLCLLIALATTAPASALTFDFVSGTARVTSQVVGQPGFLVDTVVDLDGTFIDFESAPVGVPDFVISIGTSSPIAMNGSYGGYDTFVIESALLTPGAVYSSSGSLVSGSEYSVLMGEVDVDAIYSATDSGAVTPPANNVPISFTNPTLTATIDTDLVMFEMMGVTLGVIDGTSFGEPSMIVKGDITFVGQLVPEPTTGALLGLGLAALAVSRNRSSRRGARR